MESVQWGASMEQQQGATEKAGNGCGTEKSCNMYPKGHLKKKIL